MSFPGAAIHFPMFGDNFIIDPPTYITVFGRNIYWYGIIIGFGFLLAVYYAMRRCKQFGLTQDNVLDMLLAAVPSAIIGARLYYVVFNAENYLAPGKWGNIIKIWEGGLAIYGGIIFAVIALIIVCKAKKMPILPMLDIGGLGLLIGQAIGRWGNFMNREAFGGVTDAFCRMGFLVGDSFIYVHPTFLYESLWNILGFVILHFVSKKFRKFDGQIFTMYIGWYGLGRFMIEGLRTDSLYLGSSDIRVSQLLALVCFGVAVILLLKIYVDKRGNFPPLAVELVSAAEETDEEDEEIVDDDTDFIEDENEADMINAVSNEIKE